MPRRGSRTFLDGPSRMLNLVLALLAGVITIAAPCTLPMLPILLGASVGQTSKARPVMIAAGFVLSFWLVALALSAITRVFDFDPNVLRSAAAILLAGFGLLMIWPAPFERLAGGRGGFDPHRHRHLKGHRKGERAARDLCDRRGDPDAGDCLWRAGRDHPRAEP